MVMIYTNFDRLVSFILHTKLLWKRSTGSGEEDFLLRFLLFIEVKVGNDQELAQSENHPTPKTEVGKN